MIEVRFISRPKAYFGCLLHADNIMDGMALGDGCWPCIAHGGLETYYRGLLQARTPEQHQQIQQIMDSGATAEEQKVCFILFLM